MTEVPSTISQDQTEISPFAEEFTEYMGEDLANLDFQSNIEKFSNEVNVYPEMSNRQIVLNSLTNQLGIQHLMSEEWRPDQDSGSKSGLYNTSKYTYKEINERLALETPEEIVLAFEQIDRSKQNEAEERGLEGVNIEAIQSFVERVQAHIDMDLPVEEFRTDFLSYAVVLSLKDEYKHMINKRLYFEKCPCIETLKDVFRN